MEISGEAGSVQQAVAIGVGKQSLEFNSQMVNDLMSKSLQGTQDMARAANGVGTQLNVTA